MNGLNGIIVDGKIFEAVKKDNGNPCIGCALTDACEIYGIIDFCMYQGDSTYYRFSQELTDKLNKK